MAAAVGPRPAAAELARKIARREALVGVIGLGYVGLPLVRAFCTAGFRVRGFDIDPVKVEALKAGRSYIRHIPASVLRPHLKSGRFVPTSDFRTLNLPDAILICVPTPLDKAREPDLSYVRATAESVGRTLRRGQLVVLESTTYPGTTEEIILPVLEGRGFRVGRDVFLGYSPEREDPGNPGFTTRSIPKVVSGRDPESARLTAALYGRVVDQVVPVSSLETAEAAKILENIYRCVNIALVNELKILFDRMGIDVWEVIRAASTKPFGFHPFYPGPGLGGHCIPIDPFYLSWKAREYDTPTRFIELAGEINRAMPAYVVHRTAEALNRRKRALKGARILILGVAYKADVDDMRESPALKLIELLEEAGAKVDYHDPYIPVFPPMREFKKRMKSVPLTDAMLKRQDAVLIAAAHKAVDTRRVVRQARLVVDTRNATAGIPDPKGKIVRA